MVLTELRSDAPAASEEASAEMPEEAGSPGKAGEGWGIASMMGAGHVWLEIGRKQKVFWDSLSSTANSNPSSLL